MADSFVGMVVRSDGPQVTVRAPDGLEWRCTLRGRLRKQLVGATNPLAVGDRVEVHPVAPGEGVVESLLPRRSRLARRAAGSIPREHVLAANLDLAVVVIAAPPRPTVIDRYLALVGGGGCSSLLCVNKIDLVELEAREAIISPYRLQSAVVSTSALTGVGIDELRSYLAGKLAAFVGPSGAGKSSLLYALDPTLKVRVGALRVGGRGHHTTSWAETYPLADGFVVDTPGLREVGFLEEEGKQASVDLFPEITALADSCHFRNCSHTHDPRCAVKRALEADELDPELYRRYTRLARSGRL